MTFGPVDFIVVRFPGSQFTGEIAPAMQALIDAGTIRIIDLLFLTRDSDGNSAVVEITDLDEDAYLGWDPVVDDVSGMLTEEDALRIADTLEPGNSAALVLIENTWALQLVQAIANANGEVLLSERIPRAIIEDLVAANAA
jgi:uncharacterized membrane protein